MMVVFGVVPVQVPTLERNVGPLPNGTYAVEGACGLHIV